jgi:hypothetical protein
VSRERICFDCTVGVQEMWPIRTTRISEKEMFYVATLSVAKIIQQCYYVNEIRLWRICGKTLTRKNRCAREKKTCPSPTLSTTHPTYKGLGSNSGLRGEKTGGVTA